MEIDHDLLNGVDYIAVNKASTQAKQSANTIGVACVELLENTSLDENGNSRSLAVTRNPNPIIFPMCDGSNKPPAGDENGNMVCSLCGKRVEIYSQPKENQGQWFGWQLVHEHWILPYPQAMMNARCNLEGCEFDRGTLYSAYRDFSAIATLLVYHSNNNYDDDAGLIRDVEETIEILINGWVF